MKTKAHIWVVSALAIVLTGVCSRPILAQTTRAIISGTVKDATGAVLPGATINITHVQTGTTRSLVSDDTGHYQAPELPPGDYEVEISLEGFQTMVRSGITLTVGRNAVVDVTLALGSITDKVTVSGEAPLVETTTSALSGLVGEAQIKDLPLNGRSFVQLALLEPGVSHMRSASNASVVGVGVKMSFHGARVDYNNFMMDGTSINSSSPSSIGGSSGSAMGVEMIQEFQVITANFSAEFGRNAGGVINVVSKAGSNEFHGSLFEFLRNDNMDAADFFTNRVGLKKPEFKRNQFGVTAGGPIVENKTFIFAGYEGLRERLGQTLTTNVPTAAARLGIFPDETLPVDPAVRPYLELWPLPNGVDLRDGRAEFSRGATQRTGQDFFQARVDHTLSGSDSIFVRYTIDDSNKVSPGAVPTYEQTDIVRAQYVTIEEKKVFSPAVLNVARFGFNRTNNVFDQNEVDDRILNPSLWFQPNGSVPGLGPLGVSGVDGLGGAVNRPMRRVDNTFQVNDTVNYTVGRHSLKVGADLQRVQTNEFSAVFGQGQFGFRSLKSFVQNRPTFFQGVTQESDWNRGWRQIYFGWFIQDDFRLSPKLTLNLGLRSEFMTNPNEVNGKSAHFAVDPVVTPDPIVGNPFMKLPKANFAPRLGFAWDPSGQGKTVIRGGAGLFHQMIVRYAWFVARTMPPFVNNQSQSGADVRFPHPIPLTPGTIPVQLLQAVKYEMGSLPQLMHWSLGVQRELFPSTVLRVGYVGSRGLNLDITRNPNTARPQILPDGRPFFAPGLPRISPRWTDVMLKDWQTTSDYHALQLQFSRRLSAGLQFQLSYTYSHVIDFGSFNTISDASNSGVVPQNSSDLRANRGHAAFDLRQVMVFSSVYELPLGRDLTGAAGALLKGWQLNGIVNITSGVPFSVENSFSQSRDLSVFQFSSRPDLVPGRSNSPVLGGPDKYFDPSAFALQAPGFYGTLGRNTVIGPGVATLDFGFLKRINLGAENRNLQFRAEFFNLLNHANFSNPSRAVFLNANGVPSPTAGRITSATTTSRQVQLALKLTF